MNIRILIITHIKAKIYKRTNFVNVKVEYACSR